MSADPSLDFPKLDECLLAWLGAGRWRVLGRDLRPLSLLHQELLRMAGSPLVHGGRLLLPDLDLVAQIASRSPQAAARWLARPKRRWQGRWRVWWLVLMHGWRMQRSWAALDLWRAACVAAPDMLQKEREGSAEGIPFRRDAPALLDVWARLLPAGHLLDALALLLVKHDKVPQQVEQVGAVAQAVNAALQLVLAIARCAPGLPVVKLHARHAVAQGDLVHGHTKDVGAFCFCLFGLAWGD